MINVLFPAGLLGLAVTMLVAHRWSWQEAQVRATSEADRAYRYAQFRRRVQASSLLAMVAATLMVGHAVSPDRSPKLFVALWLTVALATCWIGWLGILDAVASGRHFRNLSRQRAADRARVRAELDELVAAGAERRTTADQGNVAGLLEADD